MPSATYYNFKKALANRNLSEDDKQQIQLEKLAVEQSRTHVSEYRIEKRQREKYRIDKLERKYKHSDDSHAFDAKLMRIRAKYSAKQSTKYDKESLIQLEHIANVKAILKSANERARRIHSIEQKQKNNQKSKQYYANKKLSKLALAAYVEQIPIIYYQLHPIINGDQDLDHEYISDVKSQFQQLLNDLNSSCQHCTSDSKPFASCVQVSHVWDFLQNKGFVHFLHDKNVLANDDHSKHRALILQVYDKQCIEIHNLLNKNTTQPHFCCMCKNIVHI
jgi:hypothetical protein